MESDREPFEALAAADKARGAALGALVTELLNNPSAYLDECEFWGGGGATSSARKCAPRLIFRPWGGRKGASQRAQGGPWCTQVQFAA
jgi:hypothetical protein